MSNKFTHVGTVILKDRSAIECKIRKTKSYWVDDTSIKYSIKNGFVLSDSFPYSKGALNLSSIKEITDE